MTTPKQGQFYTAVNGDTLPSIARRAKLGDNWSLIRDANTFQFKTDDLQCIQPGEVVFIPQDQEKIALKNSQSRL